jgi:high-affinity Fe2+/Pb2+ permease
VLVNPVLTDWLITLLLVLLLLYMCTRTFEKGRRMWRKETHRAQSSGSLGSLVRVWGLGFCARW